MVWYSQFHDGKETLIQFFIFEMFLLVIHAL